MNINFDSTVLYEANDHIGYIIISQEDFSCLVNKYLRLMDGGPRALELIFSNLSDETVGTCHYYKLERTAGKIFRYIDTATQDLQRYHLNHFQYGPSKIEPYCHE